MAMEPQERHELIDRSWSRCLEAAAGHIVIEHPSGTIAVSIETRPNGDHIGVVKAGAVRTARLIMRGEVLVLPRPL
jgi:2-methylaconitate cis-trans-isomerase PrpF